MIYAIEGPDCCGKSTAVAMLADLLPPRVKIVPAMPTTEKLWACIEDVEQRQEALWRALYDPGTTYVCDRHVVVSSSAYGRLYNRDTWVDPRPWYKEITPVVIDVPMEELKRRYAERRDKFFDEANYTRLRDMYEQVLAEYPKVIRVDGIGDPAKVAARIYARVIAASQRGSLGSSRSKPEGRD